ncbi:hypothetical protein A3F38_02125 [Candidatus Saccharibacteria bacterium RIFCSPHIGHO2_12_FULL_48_21]|nr:MAG: hypothetical protein A3F38_02125 [Candidatus Saccharibacteria bacterium RIFCSPHIGHO2_12_FULL_48_21]
MLALSAKRLVLSALVSIGLMFTFFTLPALAQDCDNPTTTQDAIQCGTDNVSGSTDSPDQATTNINDTINKFINIFTAIVGVIAVVMIVVGGYRYVTSGGQPDKIAGAKNAIIYAIVGIIIAVLAQVISQFVLEKTTDTSSSGGTGQPAGGGGGGSGGTNPIPGETGHE